MRWLNLCSRAQYQRDRFRVPDTVSPRLQVVIARPLDPKFNIAPTTVAEWKARVEEAARATVATLPELREKLGVSVEATTLAGVKAFIVSPQRIRNPRRTLLHLHGGVRVLNPGEAGTREAILMAGSVGSSRSRSTIECHLIFRFRQHSTMQLQCIASCCGRSNRNPSASMEHLLAGA